MSNSLEKARKERIRIIQQESYARNRSKIRIRQKEYYLANREKIKERTKRNYSLNPEPTKLRTKRWAEANPVKVRKYKKKFRERDENRVKMRAYSVARHLRATYGLTIEERDKIFEKQKGACAICGGNAQAVDHCHTTGRIRGALCNPCNMGLGHFRDDINLLLAATDYLAEAVFGGVGI